MNSFNDYVRMMSPKRFPWRLLYYLIITILLLFPNAGLTAEPNPTPQSVDAGQAEPAREKGVPLPGTTVTEEVPFSKETMKESAERASKAPETAPTQRVAPFHRKPKPFDGQTSSQPQEQPGQQNRSPEAAVRPLTSKQLSASFVGVTDNNTAIPPDTIGAVGPTHIMETLNSQIGIFLKTGALATPMTTLTTFWSSLAIAGLSPFDPRVLYDQYNGHFIHTALSGTNAPNSWLLVSASQTADPTGTWCKWAIDADMDGVVQTGNHADFDSLGLDAGNVYVSANMFNGSDVQQYSKVWVIPKTQLYACAATITWSEFSNLTNWSSMNPAHTFGASTAEYFVAENYTGPTRFRLAQVTFAGATPSLTDLGYVEVAPYTPTDVLPGAPQLGSGNTIETNDTRLLGAVFRNGNLWTTHHVVDNTGSKTEAAWYQIDPTQATPAAPFGTPAQQGRIGDPLRWYYYPSIAVNANGDAAFGFSGSSVSEYAGAYYAGRRVTDPSGATTPATLLQPGLAPYFKTFAGTTNRWGDLSGTCVDPTDDLTFWTVQEYAAAPSGGSDRWGTYWGRFTFVALPAPTGLSATPVSGTQVNLSWTDNSIDESGFKIERKTGALGTYAQIDTAGANVTAYSDVSVAPLTNYLYRVRAYNATEDSPYTNEASTNTPIGPPPAPPAPAGGGGGGGGGSGCFIATAAYGSYLSPEVQVLRKFRDNYLTTNGPGRRFVALYYQYSPPVAAFIARHQALRTVARYCLTPLVYAVKYPWGFCILLVIPVPLLWRRRLGQKL